MHTTTLVIRRVVAAGNMRKYDVNFVPLQDNVALVTRAWMQRSTLVNWVVTWHWAHIGNFLLAFLCIPFSCAWDQVLVKSECAPCLSVPYAIDVPSNNAAVYSAVT
jgi:hypothetical protein